MRNKGIVLLTAVAILTVALVFISALNNGKEDEQDKVKSSVVERTVEFVQNEDATVVNVVVPEALSEDTLPTMTQIYNKMLNSVDYFDYAAGKFVTILDGKEVTVKFETDLNEAEGYERSTDGTYVKWIQIQDGQRTIDVDGEVTTDTFVSQRNDNSLDQKAYLAIDENGVNNYVMRNDHTNMELARCILSPQEMTFSFLSDFTKWDIVRTEAVLERESYVIHGENDEYMSQKLGTATFTIWADMETGIILKYEGYNESGEVVDYIYVDEIQIN